MRGNFSMIATLRFHERRLASSIPQIRIGTILQQVFDRLRMATNDNRMQSRAIRQIRLAIRRTGIKNPIHIGTLLQQTPHHTQLSELRRILKRLRPCQKGAVADKNPNHLFGRL